MTKEANVTVTLEEKGKMAVEVADTGGSPLSGVSVSISGPSSETATTNSNGVATFNGIQIGSYEITATLEGYFEQTTSVDSSDFQ